MYINSGYIAGVSRLNPSGTNSTIFTECCGTAICDSEGQCPKCKRKIIGYDAETDHKRGLKRWQYATAHWAR